MKKLLATVILVAAALAGCGSSSSAPSAASGPASASPAPPPTPSGSASPDPLTPHPGPVGTTQPLRTVPVALTQGRKLVSLPWEFLRLADGGKQVEISLEYGGCTAFDYAQVVQQTGSVEITIWGSRQTSVHIMCPAFVAVLRGAVTLDAPLGSRQLLHGPLTINRDLPGQ